MTCKKGLLVVSDILPMFKGYQATYELYTSLIVDNMFTLKVVCKAINV